MKPLHPLVILLGSTALLSSAFARPKPVHPELSLSVEVMARGLNQPMGLAMDPEGRDLYVADSGANRIVAVHHKQIYTHIADHLEFAEPFPHYVLSPERNIEFWKHPSLRQPVDLAFDPQGRLLVLEGGAGGRLLRVPAREAVDASVEILSTPWSGSAYQYEGLAIDAQGRLYLSAAQAPSTSPLPFGNVVKRDPDGNWWIVDYGPFAEFCNTVTDPQGHFLLVADRRQSDIAWYDTSTESVIAEIGSLKGIRHQVLLSDGTLLVTIEQADGSWSLAECHPDSDRAREWVSDLSAVGGLLYHEAGNELFISQKDEGEVLRIDLKQWQAGANKLEALRDKYAEKKFIPPRNWPEFFEPFITRLNIVHPVNEAGRLESKESRFRNLESLTMGQFAKSLPVIAGKLKASPHLKAGETAPTDPVEEIQFVLFAPQANVVTRRSLIPRISLFHAKHRSGREHTTSFMHEMLGMDFAAITDWNQMPEVILSLPAGHYIDNRNQEQPCSFRLCFTGLGLGSDYFIDVFPRENAKNRLVIDNPRGDSETYVLTPFDDAYGQEQKSLLIANIDEIHEGWMDVGKRPVGKNIVVGKIQPFHFKHSADMARTLNREEWMGRAMASPWQRSITRHDLLWPRLLVQRAAIMWEQNRF